MSEGPVAICDFDITQKLCAEAARPRLRRKYNRLVLRLGAVLLALWLAMLLYLAVTGGLGNPVLYGELAVFALALLWVRFYLPRNEGKRIWNDIQRTSIHRNFSFYADRIILRIGNEPPRMMDNAEITGYRRTRNLLILATRDGQEILLETTSFTLGSDAVVVQMLEQV